MNDYYNQYYGYLPIYNPYRISPYMEHMPSMDMMIHNPMQIKDYGKEPIAVNIDKLSKQNKYYRNTLWTGEYLQVVLMSINVNESIGLEVHPDHDQFIRIEQGQGMVMMGDSKDNLDFKRAVGTDFAVIVPAGKWHNIVNTGNVPIKLYTVYAPPAHRPGTVHKTKAEAQAEKD